MNKHTPGPWHVKFLAGAYRITPLVDSGRSIATVPLSTAPGRALNQSDAANAELIASAPALAADLATAREQIKTLQAIVQWALDDEDSGILGEEWEQQARRALDETK